jgi:hypothetical protein
VFTIEEIQTECHEAESGYLPRRNRIEYREALLDGTSAQVRWSSRPYMIAAAGDTFDNLVYHLSTWTLGCESNRRDGRRRIERMWRRELMQLKLHLPAGNIEKGTKLYVLTCAELVEKLR